MNKQIVMSKVGQHLHLRERGVLPASLQMSSALLTLRLPLSTVLTVSLTLHEIGDWLLVRFSDFMQDEKAVLVHSI